jgi:ribosomal protein S27AE
MDLTSRNIEQRTCPRCGLKYEQVEADRDYAFDTSHDNCPRCGALDPHRTTPAGARTRTEGEIISGPGSQPEVIVPTPPDA